MPPITEIAGRDFIQYWSAQQLAVTGGNPYDPAQMFALQSSLGSTKPIAIMMWNPPWLLTLMRPVLTLGLGHAFVAWTIAGFLFWCIAVICGMQAGDSRRAILPLLCGVLFYPAIDAIVSGQLGLLLAASFGFVLIAFHSRADLAAGLALVPLTVKPHLTYLVFPLALLIAVKGRRPRILIGFAGGFLALLLLTVWLYPNSLGNWWHALRSPDGSHVPTLLDWRPVTISGLLREYIWRAWGTAAPALMYGPPILTLLVAVFVAITSGPIDERWLIPALFISIATAPYAWSPDYSLLIAPMMMILCRSRSPYVLAAILLALQSYLTFVALGEHRVSDLMLLLPLLLLVTLRGRAHCTFG